MWAASTRAPTDRRETVVGQSAGEAVSRNYDQPELDVTTALFRDFPVCGGDGRRGGFKVTFRDGKKFDLGMYPVGTAKKIVFDKPGLSRIFRRRPAVAEPR